MRQYLLVMLSMFALLACDTPSAQQSAIDNYYEAKQLFWGKLYSRGGETLYCGQPFGSNGGDRLEYGFGH